MWYDADIDGLMRRTRTRPIPAGRLSRSDALAFGIVLAAFSVAILGLAANWLAAALLAFTIFFYVVIYTLWLKRADGAEHRHRRRRRRAAAGDRLGGDDGAGLARAAPLLPHHLHVDAAAFLGARALHARRLRARRHSDDAERCRRRLRPAGRSLSTPCSWRRSACFPGCSATPALPMASAASCSAPSSCGAQSLLWRRRRRRATTAPRRACSAFRSSTFSGSSACGWSKRCRLDSLGG